LTYSHYVQDLLLVVLNVLMHGISATCPVAFGLSILSASVVELKV